MACLIEVTVSPQGEAIVLTKGYAGGDCLQASQFLEQSLGITTNDTRTTEFYQPAPVEQHARQ